MMLLLIGSTWAISLDAAVKRAAEVDPNGVVATLSERIATLSEAEAWSALGPSPELSLSQRYSSGIWNDQLAWSVSLGVLSPATWLNALQQSRQQAAAQAVAVATQLDAQYAIAALYYDALATTESIKAAQEAEKSAHAVVEAANARVKAGLDSDLSGKSAELELMRAQAVVRQAQAVERVALARLTRALQQPVDSLESTQPLAMPEQMASPWLKVAEASLAAAQLGHAERVAQIFPEGFIAASKNTNDLSWGLSIGLTWSLEGVVGPVLREREGALNTRIAEVQYEALKMDLELGLTEARENAEAARAEAEVARLRENLAIETLTVGQSRLEAGLTSVLQLLRLQDEAVQARADRIRAERDLALAILSARQIAGLAWAQ